MINTQGIYKPDIPIFMGDHKKHLTVLQFPYHVFETWIQENADEYGLELSVSGRKTYVTFTALKEQDTLVKQLEVHVFINILYDIYVTPKFIRHFVLNPNPIFVLNSFSPEKVIESMKRRMTIIF